MHSSEPARRFVIGIGVGKYDDRKLDLEHATSDVTRIVQWFTRHPTVPHQQELPKLGNNPTHSDITSRLSKWLSQRKTADTLVIYVATHGLEEGGNAFLFGRDSPREKLAGMAVNARDLGAMLGQNPPQNILLIVDACMAGVLGDHIERAANDAAQYFNSRDPHQPMTLAVISSAYGRDPAHDGKFAEAFLKVVDSERWTGTQLEWIGIDQLQRGLKEELHSLSVPQIVFAKVSGNGPAELIPNPHFNRRPRSGASISNEELAAHFDPAARGAPRGEPGSYFTGRVKELRRIVQWLRAGEGEDRCLVLTGTPGSGKSALLARTVLLSDPSLRAKVEGAASLPPDTVPENDSFDCVIWCHNKSMAQVLHELADRLLHRPVESPAELVRALQGKRFTIAIDALDEAAHNEAARIAAQVLAPLLARTNLRLLIAMRRNPVRQAGVASDLIELLHVEASDVIVIDEADDHFEDMQAYVESLLRAGTGNAAQAYATNPALTRSIAGLICRAAYRSFLVAGITARTLASRRHALVLDTETPVHFPSEIGDALAAYLNRLDRPQRVRDVLRPLAYAQGAGLPWGGLWARLATLLTRRREGVNGPEYSDDDVLQVLEAAGDLIVESIENGESVYRLFHEALSEHLRFELLPDVAHDEIASELSRQLERSGWASASPYAVAHLPRHRALTLTLAQPPESEQEVQRRNHLLDDLIRLVCTPEYERAKRTLLDDPTAWLADVDLALSTLDAISPDDLRIVDLCAIYSRCMATAPVEVLEVLAKAGQVQRAEFMASNITLATARVHAFCVLAPIYAEEGEGLACKRCLDEAERSLLPVALAHRPMVWFLLCRAYFEAKLPARAHEAARTALDQAMALRQQLLKRRDTWDLGNGLFWAAMALRLVDDQEGLVRIRTALPRGAASARNQVLQAASVSKDEALLRQCLQMFTEGRRPGGTSTLIRGGNLALALADAGMALELDSLLASLAVNRDEHHEEDDAQKRFAWGLALSRRMDDALRVAKRIPDTAERLKAFTRIAKVACANQDEAVLAAIGEHIQQYSAPDPVEQVLLVKLNLVLGRQEQALVLAEIVLKQPTSQSTPYETIDEGGTSPRWKRSRRPLEPDTASTDDAALVAEVDALLAEGRLKEAIALTGNLRIANNRARALGHIAVMHPQPEVARRIWLNAIRAARRVGRDAVALQMDMAVAVLAPGAQRDEWSALVSRLANLEARWDLEMFSEHYDGLRNSIASSSLRTHRLTSLLLVPQRLARAQEWTHEELREMFSAGQPGKRMFAIGLMKGNPALFDLDIVLDAIGNSLSAFEQYHGLDLALGQITQLNADQCARLSSVIDSEKAGRGFIKPGTDRWGKAEQIEAAISGRIDVLH